jgi:hypothetical protein
MTNELEFTRTGPGDLLEAAQKLQASVPDCTSRAATWRAKRGKPKIAASAIHQGD